MTKEAIIKFLRENEWARKLRNKNKMLAELFGGRRINSDFVTEMLNADRYVRMAKKEFPELDGDLGKDDRVVAEQQFEESLGYEENFYSKVKQAQLL